LYDIDGDGYGEQGDNTGHTIVYDNVVNVKSVSIGGAAEGIAIVVNNKVCKANELFDWDKSTHPNKIAGNTDFPNNTTSGGEKTINKVHYYSDDFGKVVYDYRDKSYPDRVRLVKKFDGNPDLGRPIILTAGVNNGILRVFVALHGVNIFNMTYLNDEFYDEDGELLENKRTTIKENSTLKKLENCPMMKNQQI
jgi:hypothetical protein